MELSTELIQAYFVQWKTWKFLAINLLFSPFQAATDCAASSRRRGMENISTLVTTPHCWWPTPTSKARGDAWRTSGATSWCRTRSTARSAGDAWPCTENTRTCCHIKRVSWQTLSSYFDTDFLLFRLLWDIFWHIRDSLFWHLWRRSDAHDVQTRSRAGQMPRQGPVPVPVQLHQGRVRAEQVRQPQVLPGLLLQLNFQACIDVAGSESATEELQCLATWSEGSKNYLVAEMNREHVYSDESKYRCFVYEKYGKGDNRTVPSHWPPPAPGSGHHRRDTGPSTWRKVSRAENMEDTCADISTNLLNVKLIFTVLPLSIISSPIQWLFSFQLTVRELDASSLAGWPLTTPGPLSTLTFISTSTAVRGASSWGTSRTCSTPRTATSRATTSCGRRGGAGSRWSPTSRAAATLASCAPCSAARLTTWCGSSLARRPGSRARRAVISTSPGPSSSRCCWSPSPSLPRPQSRARCLAATRSHLSPRPPAQSPGPSVRCPPARPRCTWPRAAARPLWPWRPGAALRRTWPGQSTGVTQPGLDQTGELTWSSPATLGSGTSCASPTRSTRGCWAPRTVTRTLTSCRAQPSTSLCLGRVSRLSRLSPGAHQWCHPQSLISSRLPWSS